jgi:hypothetical protein
MKVMVILRMGRLGVYCMLSGRRAEPGGLTDTAGHGRIGHAFSVGIDSTV